MVAQEVTDKIAHTEEVVPAVAATCSATGLTEGKKCSVCDETLVAQTVVNALGHDFGTEFTVDKEATCTESGIKSKHCSRCDERSEVTEIAVIPHSLTHRLPTPATENIVGNIEYWECNECEKYFEDEDGEREIEDKTSIVLPVVTPPDNPNTPDNPNPPDNNGEDGNTPDITDVKKPKKGLSGGAIAGIVIGIILFLLLVAYVVGYFAFYRKGILKGKVYDVIYAPMNAIFGKPRTSD